MLVVISFFFLFLEKLLEVVGVVVRDVVSNVVGMDASDAGDGVHVLEVEYLFFVIAFLLPLGIKFSRISLFELTTIILTKTQFLVFNILQVGYLKCLLNALDVVHHLNNCKQINIF